MHHSVCANFGSRNWLIGTLILSLLAVAGSFLSVDLFFGIAFIFGSIAAIIAIALYGTVSGVIVAMIGSANTFILFGHPYAIVIFTLEILVVGTLYHRRGMSNLVLADLIYWLVMGSLLVVIFYQNIMGMAWTPTLLIIFKQSLNAVFNALCASIILIIIRMYPVRFLKWEEEKPRISNIFFIVGISTILLAGISPVVQQSYMLKAERESSKIDALIDKAEDIARSAQASKWLTAAKLQSILDTEYLGYDIAVAVVDNDGSLVASRGTVLSLKQEGTVKALSDESSIWSPLGKMPNMLRWQRSQYLINIPFAYDEVTSNIILESSAAPLVNSLEESNLKLFIFITGFMFISIFVVQAISHWFSQPLRLLDSAGQDMADKIASGRTTKVCKSAIYEFNNLGNTLQTMSSQLSVAFAELNQSREELTVQVKRRTRELEFLNSSLNERQFALDQHAIVSITDAAGSIIDANEKFCEISGYSRDELLGKNHRLIKSDQHSESFYTKLWQTISQGKTWQGEICNQSKNGKLYWVQSTITPFLDKLGKPYQYIAIRTNITDRKRSEELLQSSTDKLNQAQSITKVGSWEFNLKTQQLNWSKEHYKIFELSELPPDQLYEAYKNKIHVDDREPLEKLLLRTKETGEGFRFEHRLICNDGSIKYVVGISESVFNTEGKAKILRGTVQDVTEHKHAKQELISAIEEADRANKAKSEFLSSMSHELRTPMNAILGFGQLLGMDKKLTQGQLENVNEIMKGGDHLLELINEVLDLSQIESGNINLFVESVVLVEVIEECIKLIEPLALKRNISLKCGDIGGVMVLADRTRLKQSLLNLISNAIKYNKENGLITINIKQSEDNKLRILITDTGIGIAEKDLEKLFIPFTRIDDVNNNIEEGTGIGLSITKRLMALMDGEIYVTSDKGVGSTFELELRLAGTTNTGTANERNIEVSHDKISFEKKRKIVYIDDNPINLKFVTKVLDMREDVILFTSHTPSLGLELADAHLPELILLDINMPEMNGYEVLNILRKNKKFKDVTVIAVTADAMDRDVERGLSSGFDGYITKPIDLNEFYKTLDHFLLGREDV